MSYIKADDVLPQNIIKIIQQYIDGENIYIPKKDGSRVDWGAKTGVHYLLWKSGYGAGITPLLDSDGTVIVSKPE